MLLCRSPVNIVLTLYKQIHKLLFAFCYTCSISYLLVGLHPLRVKSMRKKPTETHVKPEKNFLAKPDQYCIL